MPDILTAVDETAANVIMSKEISSLAPLAASRNSTFGPFSIEWELSASFSQGTIDIIPPPADVIRIAGVRLSYHAELKLTLDLGFLDFCLPQVCVTLPFIGRVCTPRVCLSFPTIEVPVSHSSTVDFTADVRPSVTLAGDEWKVEAVIVGVPQLVLGPAATALLGVIGGAVTAALLLVPAIGPLLALASAVILASLTVANLLGVLGALLNPLVAGLRIPLYKSPRLFEILPASGQDSAVFVRLDSVVATLDDSGGEDELVLAIDISS
ncbi:hypothetical protein [Streptomyces ureilyticus]|uniref:Uncharacterized protein n=1 Tax=Streptomyces ureilyticus TaxID=1775131 RepID=A0ABX0E6F6_9ACTN|nr:hypothetical protein [Streptomyces ureilyticus]NGO49177.1 hypothetical protein [Streptomyces ureilyticus]